MREDSDRGSDDEGDDRRKPVPGGFLAAWPCDFACVFIQDALSFADIVNHIV